MGNDLRVVLGPFQSRLFGVSADKGGVPLPIGSTHLLRGASKLDAMRPMLAHLCRRTGQESALIALDSLLGGPTMRGKVPYLVLVGLRSGVSPDHATANDIEGAVLLHEYEIAGLGTGVFATHDTNGQRAVFAPEELRTQVAETAARSLIQRGALILLVCMELPQGRGNQQLLSDGDTPPCRIGARIRTTPRDLRIARTLEATVAGLGANTRRNFRRYRQRLEKNLGAFFVPEVKISCEEFVALNRNSTNPASDPDASWRYACTVGAPGILFAGVRAADGRWLSLIGGRRHDGVTEIDWQINLAGLPRYSLSTVMRSYLLEHEVSLGTEMMIFQGGTPHSMRHSLASADVLDILAMRRSPFTSLLRFFARWIFPKSNFLGQVLQAPDLTWTQR